MEIGDKDFTGSAEWTSIFLDCLPSNSIANDPRDHIAKWDIADGIDQLMMGGLPEQEPVTLTACEKDAIADNIVNESRSRSDIVQDLFDERVKSASDSQPIS